MQFLFTDLMRKFNIEFLLSSQKPFFRLLFLAIFFYFFLVSVLLTEFFLIVSSHTIHFHKFLLFLVIIALSLDSRMTIIIFVDNNLKSRLSNFVAIPITSKNYYFFLSFKFFFCVLEFFCQFSFLSTNFFFVAKMSKNNILT